MKLVLLVLIVSVSNLVGCAEPINKTTTGAITGTAIGAGTGAIIGNQTGRAGAGVAIGAAAGALGGALIGSGFDQADRQNEGLRTQLTAQERQLEENRRLIEELKSRGADVYGTERGVVINLPDVLFEFDRYNLTPAARRTVREISAVLRDVDRPIAVEGHTDSVGTVVYNRRLSLNRAEEVAKALEQDGVASRLIRVRGFGEGRPIATNNTEQGRSRNRRVEVVVENR